MKKAGLLFGLNCLMAILLIYLLSPGYYDLFHQSFFPMLIGMIIGLGVTVGVLLVDYKLLLKKKPPEKAEEEIEEKIEKDRPTLSIDRLQKYQNQAFFQKDIRAAIDQIRRYEKKKSIIYNILKEGDQTNEMECLSILEQVSDVFYQNVKALLSRMRIFDEEEYRAFQEGRLELATEEIRRQKEKYYVTLANYVDEITDKNEEIILQIDALTLQLTRANTENLWDTDSIVAMRQLDGYIKNTKMAQDLEQEVGESLCKKTKTEEIF